MKSSHRPKIAAIVAAYNEGPRIAEVLRVLTSYPGFSEVIVVDDGSTDNTVEVAMAFPVTIIEHDFNRGKAQSMQHGVGSTDAEVLFFCDADVSGLTHQIIAEILAPVVLNNTVMMIGMRNRKIYIARFILRFIPLLGGERAVQRRLWNDINDRFKEGFMIEAALNFYAHHVFGGYRYRVFEGLSQTIKEKKYGLWKGIKARLKMSVEVLKAQVELHWYRRSITGIYEYNLWWLLFLVAAVPWAVIYVLAAIFG